MEPLLHPAGVTLPFDGPSDAQLIIPEIRSEIRAGTYDADLLQLLPEAIQPGERVLVIGAGLGIVTTLLGRDDDVERLIAIEANAALIPYLHRVHEANSVAGVETINAVLAEGKKGRVPFFARRDLRTSSLMPHEGPYGQVMMIPFMDLNLILAEEQISLIICDVPLSSAQILAAADLTHVERILLSCGDETESCWAEDGLATLLASRGYQTETLGASVLFRRGRARKGAGASGQKRAPKSAGSSVRAEEIAASKTDAAARIAEPFSPVEDLEAWDAEELDRGDAAVSERFGAEDMTLILEGMPAPLSRTIGRGDFVDQLEGGPEIDAKLAEKDTAEEDLAGEDAAEEDLAGEELADGEADIEYNAARDEPAGLSGDNVAVERAAPVAAAPTEAAPELVAPEQTEGPEFPPAAESAAPAVAAEAAGRRRNRRRRRGARHAADRRAGGGTSSGSQNRWLWGLTALFIVFPLVLIDMIAGGRAGTHAAAEREIIASWGGPQTLTGPFLVIPVLSARDAGTTQPGQATAGDHGSPAEPLVILPETLEIQSELRTGPGDGIATGVSTYHSRHEIRLTTGPAASAASLLGPGETAQWDRALLGLGISEPRALRGMLALSGGGGSAMFEPGSGIDGMSGVHAAIGDPRQTLTPLRFTLELDGARQFYLTPSGRLTDWSVSSDWPTPQFSGNFQPGRHQIGATGFAAQWEVPQVAHGLPQAFRGTARLAALGQAGFGVDLVPPLDLYRTLQRASRYGLLFIVLTFGAVYLMEKSAARRTHVLQYFLIGAAQCVFFLLLLSLSEQIPFGFAYLAAAAATVALLTAYAWSGLGLGDRSLRLSVTLGLLYALMYMVLAASQLALLIGAVLAFLTVAAVMWATRNRDWEEILGRLRRGPREPGEPSPARN